MQSEDHSMLATLLSSHAQNDLQFSSAHTEHLTQVSVPTLQVKAIRNADITLLDHGTHHRPQLDDRQRLARTGVRSERERHEDLAAGYYLFCNDRLTRRESVLFLRQPAIRPECVRYRREIVWIAVHRVRPWRDLGVFRDEALSQ